MSREFRFLKITPVSQDCPEVIDLEETQDERLAYVREDLAADWQKQIGLKRKVSFLTVDLNEVGEKLYHKKVSYISWSGWENGPCFHFEDGLSATVSNNKIKPYYHRKEESAYVYLEESVCDADCYFFNVEKYDQKILSVEDLTDMLEELFSEADYDSCEAYARSLYAIGKCMVMMRHEDPCYIIGDYS